MMLDKCAVRPTYQVRPASKPSRNAFAPDPDSRASSSAVSLRSREHQAEHDQGPPGGNSVDANYRLHSPRELRCVVGMNPRITPTLEPAAPKPEPSLPPLYAPPPPIRPESDSLPELPPESSLKPRAQPAPRGPRLEPRTRRQPQLPSLEPVTGPGPVADQIPKAPVVLPPPGPLLRPAPPKRPAPQPQSRPQPHPQPPEPEQTAPASVQISTEPPLLAATTSRAQRLLEQAEVFLDRFPWLLPSASFLLGWVGFFLFQRGEALARAVAVIALVGWPWLLAENLLGRWVVARSKGRLSISAVRFVTQQIQQEILFFSLPFMFGASLLVPGHIAFMALAAVVALAVSLDPIYLHRIAPHAGLSSALHAYCTLIAALVVLPIVLHLPLDQALPMALAITALSLLLSLPRMLLAVSGWQIRVVGCVVLVSVLGLLWGVRGWIPPAGLWVRDARIAHYVDGLEPGPPLERVSVDALRAQGAVAFVAVRAPVGLSQAVVFDWRQDGQVVDRIPAQISGGREGGFRTFSRKENFPADPRGQWHVDLRTPDGQLISRMRFVVE